MKKVILLVVMIAGFVIGFNILNQKDYAGEDE